MWTTGPVFVDNKWQLPEFVKELEPAPLIHTPVELWERSPAEVIPVLALLSPKRSGAGRSAENGLGGGRQAGETA